MTAAEISLLGGIAVFSGIGLMVARVFVAGRAIKRQSPEMQQRYRDEGRLPQWREWPLLGALALAFVSNTPIKVGAVLAYLALTVINALASERRLRASGFDDAFRRAQWRVAMLGGVGVLMLVGGFLLPSFLG